MFQKKIFKTLDMMHSITLIGVCVFLDCFFWLWKKNFKKFFLLKFWKKRHFFDVFQNFRDIVHKTIKKTWYMHQISNMKKIFCFKKIFWCYIWRMYHYDFCFFDYVWSFWKKPNKGQKRPFFWCFSKLQGHSQHKQNIIVIYASNI